MLDLLLEGGVVVDGTGGPRAALDVGIVGDQIVYVGARSRGVEASLDVASQVVGVKGHVVAPGFIDIHAHSDYSLLINRKAESAIHQGVTTEVVGNCGMGCAPLADPAHLPLMALEYLPGPEISWRSFGQWLEALERGGLAINVAALCGHGAVRLAVLGQASQQATVADVRQMVRLVEQSMEEGAFGFSSGLEYYPGKGAGADELRALARAARTHGGLYSTHIRNRDYAYAEAIDEAIATASAAEVSLQISHVAPRWGAAPGSAAAALERIDQAVRDGVDVWIDNHPYTFGRGLVMSAFPPQLFEGGVERLRERLQDPAQRRAMRDYATPQWKHWREGHWDLLTVYDAPHNRHWQGRTIQDIAETTRRDPWDVVCDLLQDEWRHPSGLYWSAPLHLQEDVDAGFRHARSVIMSDGSTVAPYGPYRDVRNVYSYGWVSHVLRAYVRERQVLTLEEAIHKLSGLPARRLGLSDRGIIAPGMKADLVVFDPGQVRDKATFDQPIAYPEGIRYVWVNGALAVAGGAHTGALAGRVLRHAASSS
jgi:N-acyl-D-aspartate/D-glutamate deacylase